MVSRDVDTALGGEPGHYTTPQDAVTHHRVPFERRRATRSLVGWACQVVMAMAIQLCVLSGSRIRVTSTTVPVSRRWRVVICI